MPTNVYNISYPNQKIINFLPLMLLTFGVVDVGTIDVVHYVEFFFMTSMVLKTKTSILGYQ
jgi:hypothetical protein